MHWGEEGEGRKYEGDLDVCAGAPSISSKDTSSTCFELPKVALPSCPGVDDVTGAQR